MNQENKNNNQSSYSLMLKQAHNHTVIAPMEQPFLEKKKTITNLNKRAIITLATKQILLKQTISNFNDGAILKTMKEYLLK